MTRYLSNLPMTFAYASGKKKLADPKDCSHAVKRLVGSKWICTRCGKELE
jgi:hypothetical protein